MRESIQFIQVSPEQFKETILTGIQEQFKNLMKEFQPMKKDEYLSRDEVAKMFKVNISTIHNWCKSGKLIRHCIGNRVYFKKSEIENSLVIIK
jgi:DNA-binding transcriptional regulator YiaG